MTKEESKNKLIRAISLEENWDSYGGLPAEKECIERACLFIDSFPADPYFVCSGPNGECYVEYRSDGDNLQAEIFFESQIMNESDNFLLCKKKEDHKLAINGSFDYEEFQGIDVEKIKNFLNIC
jgi:hypothetical protein